MRGSQTHSRSNSYAHSISSNRNSMDMIEGTTQYFSANKNDEPTVTAHVQRQRWDAFFDPQYTFGSFIHGTNPGADQRHQHKKKMDRLIDDGNSHLPDYMRSPTSVQGSQSMDISLYCPTPVAESPSLPRIDKLKLSIANPSGVNVSDAADKDKPLLNPSEEKKLVERLELLKKIRGTTLTNTNTNAPNQGQQAPTTWRQHITEKAKQLRKTKAEDAPMSSSSSPSLSFGDEEKWDFENKQDETNVWYKRRSFICFVVGFLFFPSWIFGSIHISSYSSRQTSANRRIDHHWRRRCRIALGVFSVLLMVLLIIVFVLKPGSIGWRQSKPLQH